jgi:DNA polymerase III subunit delta
MGVEWNAPPHFGEGRFAVWRVGVIAELVYKSGSPQLLWKPDVLSVYLLWGEEDRLKTEAANALIKKIVNPDFADFDLEQMDASDRDADSILSAANQIPFGSDRRVVVVRGMELWRERGKAGDAEKLADGIGRFGDGICLILITAAEEDEGKRKTAVSVKLDNAVKKHGVTVVCNALKGDNLIGWVQERVGQEGKRITPDAAQQLIGAAGSEMMVLEQEIIKLVCFVGDNPTVTGKDVAEVVASSPEDVMFTVVDAITKRQTDRALLLLAELHRYDPKPQAVAGKLLALLARQYRMLWQAKFLADKRVNPRDVRNLPPELAAELPTEGNIAQVAFKASEMFATARNYTWGELSAALEKLLLCDLANKGGATEETGLFGTDPAGNLQLLVLELTASSR